MAAELKDTLNIDAELIRGGGGVFDVAVDGEVVYTKAQTGRFPQRGEVTKAIAARHDNA